jgi:hypothetical protein
MNSAVLLSYSRESHIYTKRKIIPAEMLRMLGRGGIGKVRFMMKKSLYKSQRNSFYFSWV